MTTRKLLSNLTANELIDEFTKNALGMYDSERLMQPRKYDQFCLALIDVNNELKNRPGDGRFALIKLYSHPNIQVRLSAAKLTGGINPAGARKVLEKIAASRCFPQAGVAGMSLEFMDGTFPLPETAI